MSDEVREVGFYWVTPWRPDAVTVLSGRLVFRPRPELVA
jgi:hypothetical protein